MNTSQLPYSLQAEQAVLGGLILDNITWSGISEHLVSKDFYQLEHQILFDQIIKKIKKGEKVDVLTLSEAVKTIPELKEIKGDIYVMELMKTTFSTSNIGAYVDIIKEHSNRRQLIEIGQLLNDYVTHKNSKETLVWLENKIQQLNVTLSPENKLQLITLIDFLTLNIAQRELILSPWLPKQGLAMLYAKRGVGKTHVALNIAYTVASGGSFLGWKADKPCSVLYLDGEMPAATMQERLASIVISHEKEAQAPFTILTPDIQNRGMPDLSTLEGQQALEPFLKDVEFIVVDNISTLCRTGKENEAEGWILVQAWALRMRSEGRSVLFVHHAAKNGNARGTSKREDVLDTVIVLKHPNDYDPSEGASFEIHFEKARSFCGESAQPLLVKLHTEYNKQVWELKTLEKSTFEKVIDLANQGFKQHEIVLDLGISKSKASRYFKKAKEEGCIVHA
ncbi:AAA family ATPase [Rickettsiella endosymbiont of Xylota segnis]|uniref:AAA family ATPase n=1 Tax=Rickettsiella endosymbiont of Xylota segnis TaxID=3066238 RepID=UPI0030CD93F1